MKNSRLIEIIREVIEEEMIGEVEPGQRRAALGWGAGKVGDEAKKLGLDYLGFGRYGKNGEATHQSKDGKLEPIIPNVGKTGINKKPASSVRPQSVVKPKLPTWAPLQPGSGATSSEWDEVDSLKPKGRNFSKGEKQLFDKIHSKVASSNVHKKLIQSGKYDYFEPIPMREFEKITGINRKAADYYTQQYSDEDKAFEYQPESDTVEIYGS